MERMNPYAPPAAMPEDIRAVDERILFVRDAFNTAVEALCPVIAMAGIVYALAMSK